MSGNYKVPCGKTTGHGEQCSTGRLCGGCEEIERLRAGTPDSSPIYKCKVCGNDHLVGSHCERRVQALRAYIGLYARTMEEMMKAEKKSEMAEIHKGLVFGKPEGDMLAAGQLLAEANS